MALSDKAQKRLEIALGNKSLDNAQVAEIVAAINAANVAGAAVANVATADADATYGQPEADLINELKTKVNALLASLRAAGKILP